MTTVAIMQPYLFPYIGYYQLVAAADIFVFLDDVNFIKRGFVNRNRIIDRKGNAVRFTLPVQKASQNRQIREHFYANDNGKTLKSIEHCYTGAPGYSTWIPLLQDILHNHADKRVSELNETSIRKPLTTLDIEPRFSRSSELDPQSSLVGDERILNLCQTLRADRYINLPGGRALYSPDRFAKHGIELKFLDSPAPVRLPDHSAENPSFLHYLMTDRSPGESANRVLATNQAPDSPEDD